MRSTPHRCERCVEQASYYGILVFGDAKPPKCRVHKVELEPIVIREPDRSQIDRIKIDLRHLPTGEALKLAFLSIQEAALRG